MRQIAGAFAELEKARLVAKLRHARERIRSERGKCEGRKTRVERAERVRLAAGIGRLLETPATCRISVAAARLLPRLVTGMVAATRLRRFGDIAASLGVQRSMAMK
jgi:hypothetical protein